jgi:SAM-dependent methyltransferase
VRRSLLELLVDPAAGTPLALEPDAEEVEEGVLRGADGRVYPIRDGIPRFVATDDEGQRQTGRAFGYKWGREDSYGSAGMARAVQTWLLERYGFASPEEMRAFFGAGRRTLDAGCGAGLSTSVWLAPGWSRDGAEWVGVDISSAIDVARKRLGTAERTHFVQADFLELPFGAGAFDAIFAEGTLHHTPSTRAAFDALVRLLAPGGELMFYVYRLKAPVRELTDDYVRARLADLSPEEAWEALRPLTRLAQALAELETTVEVPEDVPLLGVPAGRHDVQRLVYWHFAKLFWNPEFSFEENLHVNFDWYHPRYAHRHTEEEVRAWCDEAGLEIVRLDAQESGLTVRARRP